MISTKGRYALRVMIDIAEHGKDGPVPLKDTAARQEISKKYLEIIVKELVNGGFLSGVSGRGGGYRLTRAPHEYTLKEILEMEEGSLAPVACLMCGASPCSRAENCRTLPMWKEYQAVTDAFFSSRTLADLIAR